MSQEAELSRPARSAKRSPEELHSWKQVNQRLASLGEAERQIRSLTDEFRQKVAVLKQEWLEASHPLVCEMEKLKSQLERFYWAHREEMLACGRKSVNLAFGRLGSRHMRRVVVLDATAATQWLRENGFKRYLRTRTVLDREALRSALICAKRSATAADASDLVSCPDIRLQEADEFWYQVDESPIDRAPLPGARLQPFSVHSAAGTDPHPVASDPRGEEPALELFASAVANNHA